ncbi:hypothetical protein RGU70_08460 [Herbaspirillum sp. RTI4]|uniref:hypothetical protein n=1 Tax=Herbaspirillum sp. RTI4 TaxID=3048640 RepID=UPI002AB453D7|nr:hypothetical protein [Herbaspirillum sp. RTI4]MDY7578352.1 hypothetical protein [Herbaspirillum sp. RTI4]MEA9981155.1 hypothetical protein [Herbaspirillum sp. RTI4]
MPKLIQLAYPAPRIEGVLIPRSALQEGQYAYRLLRYAQARAKKIVAIAEKSASEIQRQAYVDAYSNTLLQCLGDFLARLNNAEKLHHDIQKRLLHIIQHELTNLLGQSEFINLLLSKWASEQPCLEEKKMTVFLPTALIKRRDDFIECIQHWMGFMPSVVITDEPRITIEYGEFVHEFDTEKFMGEMYPEVVGAFKQLNLRGSVEELSRQSVDMFLRHLDRSSTPHEYPTTDKNNADQAAMSEAEDEFSDQSGHSSDLSEVYFPKNI